MARTIRYKIGALYRAWCAGVAHARAKHELLVGRSVVTDSAVLWRAFVAGHTEMSAALRRGSRTIRSSRPFPQMELDFDLDAEQDACPGKQP